VRPATALQDHWNADHGTARYCGGATAAPSTVGVAGERRATALGVAVLLAVLTAGAALLAQSQTQASTGAGSPEALWGSDDAVAGRQASELFLEYLYTVIAKR
jgi:uncharacterized protein HemX